MAKHPTVEQELEIEGRQDKELHEEMAKASPVAGSIQVVSCVPCEGDLILEVDCHDFDKYMSLPAGLEYCGKEFGKTGWNSDTGRCCYKSSQKFAKTLVCGTLKYVEKTVDFVVSSVDLVHVLANQCHEFEIQPKFVAKEQFENRLKLQLAQKGMQAGDPFDGLYDDQRKNSLLAQCWAWVKEKYPDLF